jgi:hypothetical protein
MDTGEEPAFLVKVLSELAEPLYESVDDANAIAVDHFDGFGMTGSAYRAGRSHLARCHVRRLLVRSEARGELGGWRVAPPGPNVQVCLNRHQLQLRLLRPDQWQVPRPGTNSARIAWFSNQHATLGGIEASNLVGLWAVGADGQMVIRVVRTIGLPLWGRRNRVDLDLTLPRVAAAVETLEFRPIDDRDVELPFEQRDEGTGIEGVDGS